MRDIIAEDALNVFCNTSEFAETVTYMPRSGALRSIVAVVMREEITLIAEDGGQANAPVWRVHVHNSETTGISSTELNMGGDKISFSPRDGQQPIAKVIQRLLLQDHGMLVLECR